MPDKPFNGGQWTQARFNSFIKSALRSATKRWGPVNEVRKKARVDRGVYMCAGYKKRKHKVRYTEDKKRNIFVDHIEPIIGPEGFKSWDETIRNMFCEEDGLQLLCRDCHDRKTKDERKAYYDYRKKCS